MNATHYSASANRAPISKPGRFVANLLPLQSTVGMRPCREFVITGRDPRRQGIIGGMQYLCAFCMCGAAMAAGSAFEQSRFAIPLNGWTTWAARPEIAPRTFVDSRVSRGEAGSLAISGNSNAAAHGGWEYRFASIQEGQWCRFEAHYRAEGLRHPWLEVVAKLDWMDAQGRRAGQP